MKTKKWKDFYNMYISIMERTEKEISELRGILFASTDNREPFLNLDYAGATGEEYYKFVSEILKVTNPLFSDLGEEYYFKKAGMLWLYEYHEKTAHYSKLKELYSKQHEYWERVDQANAFIKMRGHLGDRHIADLCGEYMSLCEKYPNLYNMDIFPFEINPDEVEEF